MYYIFYEKERATAWNPRPVTQVLDVARAPHHTVTAVQVEGKRSLSLRSLLATHLTCLPLLPIFWLTPMRMCSGVISTNSPSMTYSTASSSV